MADWTEADESRYQAIKFGPLDRSDEQAVMGWFVEYTALHRRRREAGVGGLSDDTLNDDLDLG